MKSAFFTTVLMIMLSIGYPATSWSAGQRGNQRLASECQNLSTDSPSPEERDDLMLMREEEKMARDLYLSFNRLYGSRVRLFANIATAEQTHMNAVKQLLNAYGLPDPVKSNRIGIFSSQALTNLYNDLLAKGQKGLVNAFKVGVTVEETDISDLAQAIERSDETCIDRVYLNLLRGSENHLEAFNRQLERNQ